MDEFAAAAVLEGALLHPVVALLLVELLAAVLGSDATSVLGPPAVGLLLRIDERLEATTSAFAVRRILLVTMLAAVVALGLVGLLSPERHPHLAAPVLEATLDQAVEVHLDYAAAAVEVLAQLLDDRAYGAAAPVLVDAQLLVLPKTPVRSAHVAADRLVAAGYALVVVIGISRLQLFAVVLVLASEKERQNKFSLYSDISLKFSRLQRTIQQSHLETCISLKRGTNLALQPRCAYGQSKSS